MPKRKENEDPINMARPLSNYERRHGHTIEMRSLKGARRTRAYRWDKQTEP